MFRASELDLYMLSLIKNPDLMFNGVLHHVTAIQIVLNTRFNLKEIPNYLVWDQDNQTLGFYTELDVFRLNHESKTPPILIRFGVPKNSILRICVFTSLPTTNHIVVDDNYVYMDSNFIVNNLLSSIPLKYNQLPSSLKTLLMLLEVPESTIQ